MPLCSYERMLSALQPCDVLLIEGRSRVSEVIKIITQSPWSHAALYIGRLNQIQEPRLRAIIQRQYQGSPQSPLIVEALMGQGVVVNSLEIYRSHHIRICRPKGISQWDALKVMDFAIRRLGDDYDMRQILDLARFLFPYGLLPRRFRSSLFEHRAGVSTRTVCSSMLAQAFMSVNFPILPVVQRGLDGTIRLYNRNFRLFTPRDFDYSPYFEIIKYPLIGHDDLANYHNLPWDPQGLMCNGEGDCFLPNAPPTVAPSFSRRLHRWLSNHNPAGLFNKINKVNQLMAGPSPSLGGAGSGGTPVLSAPVETKQVEDSRAERGQKS
ncbi:MAG: hypothetical protein G8345_15740 [Magnetococcales bacterium]|nr:hypothetical protein [Magnetococcales bacterium]